MRIHLRLAVVGVVALAGCTSAASSGGPATPADDASASVDAVTIEDVSICTATEQCAVIGSGGANFDESSTCGACDICLASMCCDVATTCLAPNDAGSESACENLAECEMACAMSDAGSDDAADDGGDACSASCESAFDSATIAAFDAFVGCYAMSCASACP